MVRRNFAKVEPSKEKVQGVERNSNCSNAVAKPILCMPIKGLTMANIEVQLRNAAAKETYCIPDSAQKESHTATQGPNAMVVPKNLIKDMNSKEEMNAKTKAQGKEIASDPL